MPQSAQRAMPMPAPNERENTDLSLLQERKKTDAEIGKRDSASEIRSDQVVERARERADEVLAGARDEADETLDRHGATPDQRRTLEISREQADVALDGERELADEKLEEERSDHLHALGQLLRFEREQTDERLLLERASGDASLAARDDFMGLVSHDLRMLLGGIALAAAVQIKHAGTGEAAQINLRAAERIQRLTARTNRLVGDLVDVASIEAGRFAVVPREQDAQPLLQECVDAFGPAATAKHLTLTELSVAGPLIARFDHDRVMQVLCNLVSNAIKFSGEGGRVVVHAEQFPDRLQLSVSDTGPGIAPGDLEDVFERFWQVTRGDKRGLGLGLFISRCVVEAHQGRLWVESEPGKGSTFRFTIPR